MSVDLAVESAARPRALRRRSVRRYVAAAVVLVVACGALSGAWWWKHPTAFDAAPASPSLGLGEVQVAGGSPLHVSMAHPLPDVDGSVTLTGVEAHVVGNSAQAVLTFQVCIPASQGSISSVSGDLSRWCDAVADLGGATIPLDSMTARPQVIMTIQGSQPGELRVQGIDLSYEYGPQSGTQRVGEYVWLRYD